MAHGCQIKGDVSVVENNEVALSIGNPSKLKPFYNNDVNSFSISFIAQKEQFCVNGTDYEVIFS